MKKNFIFLLLLSILLVSANSALAEWRQVGQGMYIGDFAKNGNYLTYSTKIDKTSPIWQQYMTDHKFSENDMGNFDSMVLKSTYDCSLRRIMVNSIQYYDASGNQMGAFVDQTWRNDPNNSADILCKQNKLKQF